MDLFESSQNSSNPRLDVISDYTNIVPIWELSRHTTIPLDCRIHNNYYIQTLEGVSVLPIPFYDYIHKKLKSKLKGGD